MPVISFGRRFDGYLYIFPFLFFNSNAECSVGPTILRRLFVYLNRLRDRSFPLAEVEAFNVKQGGDEVNEDKSYDSSVDVDDIPNIDLEKSNQKADSNHNSNIDNLRNSNFSAFWLLKPNNPKKSLSE